MWLICFQPLGTNEFVPQIICYSEQEAKQWVKNAPISVVGNYVYMYVPTSRPMNYFKREEPYQFPAYQPAIPYYVDTPRRNWQNEIGDWPFSQPPMCLN